jgi:hypothetical protein
MLSMIVAFVFFLAMLVIDLSAQRGIGGVAPNKRSLSIIVIDNGPRNGNPLYKQRPKKAIFFVSIPQKETS